MDDEIIRFNPAVSIGRHAKRTRAAKVRDKVSVNVKAMDREQRNRLFAVAAVDEPDHYPAFLIGALAGLRRDEILALRWPSVDFQARKIRVHEQLLVGLTKSGDERSVDMASPLVDLLRTLQARRPEESMAAGQGGDVSPYVVLPWLSDRPTAKEAQRARKRLIRAMQRCLRIAGLPPHFTPHSLRHTFCALLISEDVSPVYVQQQGGHADVEIAVSVYGSWFPTTVAGAMDRLAEGVPAASPVTFQALTGNIAKGASAQVLPPTGTCGARTASRPSPA